MLYVKHLFDFGNSLPPLHGGTCFQSSFSSGLPRPDGGLLLSRDKRRQKRAKTYGFGFP